MLKKVHVSKKITVAGLLIIGVMSWLLYQYQPTAAIAASDYYIYEFNDDERDIKDIENMFKEDLYWLTTRDQYDVRGMLTRRTSDFTDQSCDNNMFIYVMREQGTELFIGFISFFKLSFYKGKILFLSINKSFRGKRYGEKLVAHVLDVMKKMGMMKATLFTRLDNKPARALYERIGFKRTHDVDKIGLYYDIYL